jgi:Protein of unknown function (DUF3800)
MYLCYVDESGDPGLGGRGSKHLLLGAALLFEGRWVHAKTEINTLLTKYFPTAPRPRELHCTEIRRGRNECSRLTWQQRRDLLDEFCQLATAMLDVELRMFTVVYDKAWWAARNPGRTGSELYVEAFENLVSRVDLFLRRRYAEGRPSKGLFVVDPHTTDLSTALKGALAGFQDGGTRWANIFNVIETVMFLHSHESPGLQLADLCSYAVWRLVEHSDAALAQNVSSCFDREPMTSAKNAGKWHGVKYFGPDPVVDAALRSVWGP